MYYTSSSATATTREPEDAGPYHNSEHSRQPPAHPQPWPEHAGQRRSAATGSGLTQAQREQIPGYAPTTGGQGDAAAATTKQGPKHHEPAAAAAATTKQGAQQHQPTAATTQRGHAAAAGTTATETTKQGHAAATQAVQE